MLDFSRAFVIGFVKNLVKEVKMSKRKFNVLIWAWVKFPTVKVKFPANFFISFVVFSRYVFISILGRKENHLEE